ncbi:MAG: SUMF1/EgtB/PvdO family nonheme iron enzyme, partial [Candidatus Cloacimonetes bacterium]|nr:SUMF1/EgtB/PvdO family nonheme iron enzyme [Candidatus Cloacimonadota bacterium]
SVGGKQANELGIYDMSGNAWEWCWDRYNESYYSKSESRDPRGSGSGSYRSLRGGSWYFNSNLCRVSYRYCSVDPLGRYYDFGVRVLRANL